VKSLQTIEANAAGAKLTFLLAGGHAVIAHGHPRTTFDIDLIARKEDRAAWLKLAQELGYTLHHSGPTFAQFAPSDSKTLPLDLMFVAGRTFEKLLADAVSVPGQTGAKIVSLAHLLALKCHAIKHGHAGRVVKDVDDVIHLVQANQVNLAAPEIHELFLKHGTAELYEKIQRICRQD